METTNGNKNRASTNGYRYAFDDFEIDPANRTCLRGGEVVPLTGKVFDVLLVFAENPGRLLEKDELIEKVWHDDFVEEGNLARNVSTLRKALGDVGKENKYIITVQGHGYRFVADVAELKNGSYPAVVEETGLPRQIEKIPTPPGSRRFSRKWLWVFPLAVLLIAAAWIGKERFFTPASRIRSLAVLPLKSLDTSENYLGVGIADAVIRRISQTGQMIVRPTSAVLHYRNEDTDALAAARQLSTDAVLEGTVQYAGDRLRVSVNLLRTSDGTSLWADSFDMRAGDVFMIQDTVAKQVATRLQLQIDPAQQTGLNKQYTSSPIAYDFYVKGIYNLDQRGNRKNAKPQMVETFDLFKKAIEFDPNYALASAQLAYAYSWTASFIEPTEPKWAELAKQEIKRSQDIDPQLAESHVANALLLWSAHEGFQNEAAVRELLLAQQLNPNTGHADLAAIYGHMGLEDLASRELQRALDIDPTSQTNNDLTLILYDLAGRTDEYLTLSQKLDPEKSVPTRFLMRKGQFEDAQTRIDGFLKKYPDEPDLLLQKSLLLALRGDFSSAEAAIPGIVAKLEPNHPYRHHNTYDIACVYALAGKSDEAVKWLKETAATGFPNYPLFERDPYLDRIRQAPEFNQFMADQKAQWEKYKQEFGEN